MLVPLALMSILILSQLSLMEKHRLVQPRDLLTKHVNLGPKQRQFLLPGNLLGKFLRNEPRTNHFHHLLWQPKRLQMLEEHRRVCQTVTRCRRRCSGRNIRRRLTVASPRRTAQQLCRAGQHPPMPHDWHTHCPRKWGCLPTPAPPRS